MQTKATTSALPVYKIPLPNQALKGLMLEMALAQPAMFGDGAEFKFVLYTIYHLISKDRIVSHH